MPDDIGVIDTMRRHAVPVDIESAAPPLLGAIDPKVSIVLIGEATGVIYRSETDRASHYLTARLPRQFDLVVHIDRTRAVEPLERWGRHEVDLPETYPTGV